MLAKRLKEKRREKNLSQIKLAEMTGLNVRTIQHYEQGSKNFDHARLDTILKICIVLNCKLEEIVEDPTTLELLKKLNA